MNILKDTIDPSSLIHKVLTIKEILSKFPKNSCRLYKSTKNACHYIEYTDIHNTKYVITLFPRHSHIEEDYSDSSVMVFWVDELWNN